MTARRAGLTFVLLAILAPGCAQEDPEAVWDQARAAFEARDFDRARALMERMASLRDPTAEDHLLRAQLLIERGRVDEALVELGAVPEGVRLDGADLLLVDVDGGGAIPGEGRNLIVVARSGGRLHFRIFDRGGKLAVDEGEAGLKGRAGWLAGLKARLADLWPPHALTREEKERTIALLAPVFDHSGLAAQAHYEMGHIALQRDRARVAEGHFRDAIRLLPGYAKAHRELIFILGYELRRRELSEAFAALSECEPLRFDQAFLWCLTRGMVWEPGEAAGKLAKFVAADPDDRQARLALAEMQRRLTRYGDAEATLAPLGDDDPDARVIRAQLALDQGDEAKAVALLAGGPKVHLGLALLRGRMAIARGDDKAAVAAFRDAVAAEPNNRDAIFGLAHILQRVNDSEAKHYLDLSARHERLGTLVQRASNPGSDKDVALIHDLGAACAAVGRLAEARAWYTVAIKIDAFDSEAQQALYRLKGGGKPPA